MLKEKKKSETKGKRLIVVSVAVFLGAVLLFGVILGTVALVRSIGAVVSYQGVAIDKGSASYLAATYKNVFLRTYGLGERVSDSLWESPSEPDPSLTWGELLAMLTESYVNTRVVPCLKLIHACLEHI